MKAEDANAIINALFLKLDILKNLYLDTIFKKYANGIPSAAHVITDGYNHDKINKTMKIVME